MIEIQNDILKFIDIAFALLIIEVLVAVDIFAANELNRDLNQYQCQKKLRQLYKRKKNWEEDDPFFYETDYHNEIVLRLQISSE